MLCFPVHSLISQFAVCCFAENIHCLRLCSKVRIKSGNLWFYSFIVAFSPAPQLQQRASAKLSNFLLNWETEPKSKTGKILTLWSKSTYLIISAHTYIRLMWKLLSFCGQQISTIGRVCVCMRLYLWIYQKCSGVCEAHATFIALLDAARDSCCSRNAVGQYMESCFQITLCRQKCFCLLGRVKPAQNQ